MTFGGICICICFKKSKPVFADTGTEGEALLVGAAITTGDGATITTGDGTTTATEGGATITTGDGNTVTSVRKLLLL